MSVKSLSEGLVEITPALRIYALFLTKSSSAADDLVQDALERAWRHRLDFREGSNLKAWVFTILRNRFMDEHRRGRPLVEDVDGTNAARLIHPASQHWRLQYVELMGAIYALPGDTRDALLLVMGAGLSHEEAAAVMGCPLGTLKSRIRRARAQLLDVVEIEDGLGAVE